MDGNADLNGLVTLPKRLFSTKIERSDILVYAALANQRVMYTHEITAATGVSKRAVHGALRRLYSEGLVEMVKRGTHQERTRFRLPDLDRLPLVS